MSAEESPPVTEEYQNNRHTEDEGWRRALIVLLFLLFSFLCLLCSSQGALYFVDRERISGSMRSRQQADYGVGPVIELSPLDRDKLLTEVPKDQTDLETSQTPQAVAVVIVPLPHATLVAQVPTVVPPIPTLTPTSTPTPTPTPIPGSGSTPGTTPTGQQTPIPTSSPAPTTPAPTTTGVPTTAVPTTAVPTTAVPTTAVPTTAVPTTAVPTTAVPTTAVPTTAVPTTAVPTTAVPTTAVPTPTFTPTPTTPAPTNSPPSPANDVFTIPEDSGPTAINVLGNDTDPDNDIDPTTVTIISGPANGTATVNPTTGAIIYTPNPNFFGTELIIYQVCDDNGACATATLTITVTPVPDPPIAINDLAMTDEEVPTTTIVLANDSDPDNDPLSVISVTQPPNGTVVINPNNTVTYTPTPNFFGTNVFTYTISDGLLTDSARVTVTVKPIPDPPVAVDDLASTAEDSPEDVLVLDNDFDVDNDPLTVILVGTPMSGTVTHNGTLVTYTPLPNVNGTDVFTYTITDGLFTDTATVTMTIFAINDPPVAFNNAYTISLSAGTFTEPAPGVLGNDTDVDSAVLTATLVIPPSSGTLILNSNGSFSYTPVLTGTYSFTYQAEDNLSASNVATVVINVFP